MKPAASFSLPRLLLGLTVTLVASLSVHAVMLQGLHVPFPSRFPRRGWPIVPDQVLFALGAVYLSRWLPPAIRRRSLLFRCLLLFVLLATMQEILFRSPFMNFINLSGFTLYPFLDNAPRLIAPLVLAVCVELWNRQRHRFAANLLLALVLGIVLGAVLAPAVHALFQGMVAFTATREGDQRFGLPYGWQILLPAYLTFLEPALAALWIAFAIRPQLPPSPLVRVLGTAALILALKGPVFAPVLNVWYAGLPAGTAMLSYAQFTFESAVLGLLTAATVAWSVRGGTSAA